MYPLISYTIFVFARRSNINTAKQKLPSAQQVVLGEQLAATNRTTSGFDDPQTCGTFALRRLCLCGLGFVLIPPRPTESKTARGGIGKHPRRASKICTGRNSGPLSATPTLVALAYGHFLHPDATALDNFFLRQQGVAKSLLQEKATLGSQGTPDITRTTLPATPPARDGTVGMRVHGGDVKQVPDDACFKVYEERKMKSECMRACLVSKMTVGGIRREILGFKISCS